MLVPAIHHPMFCSEDAVICVVVLYAKYLVRLPSIQKRVLPAGRYRRLVTLVGEHM
jgi:hypothetical protein